MPSTPSARSRHGYVTNMAVVTWAGTTSLVRSFSAAAPFLLSPCSGWPSASFELRTCRGARGGDLCRNALRFFPPFFPTKFHLFPSSLLSSAEFDGIFMGNERISRVILIILANAARVIRRSGIYEKLARDVYFDSHGTSDSSSSLHCFVKWNFYLI